MDILEMLKYFEYGGYERSINERKELEKNGEVLTTNVENYTIDSCYTWDAGYETAIWLNNNRIVIVEYYKTKEKMQKGHQKWCEFCKTKPKKVFSVQNNVEESLESEE